MSTFFNFIFLHLLQYLQNLQQISTLGLCPPLKLWFGGCQWLTLEQAYNSILRDTRYRTAERLDSCINNQLNRGPFHNNPISCHLGQILEKIWWSGTRCQSYFCLSLSQSDKAGKYAARFTLPHRGPCLQWSRPRTPWRNVWDVHQEAT